MERLVYPFRALGSSCEFQLYGDSREQLEDVAAAGHAEIRRIEIKYSRYRDDSVVSQINRSAETGVAVSVDAETCGLLDYAQTAYEQSGGVFDITSGVLRRVWDFKSGKLPAAEEVDELLQLVGWSRVEYRQSRISLPRRGMEIDFGGFGKEYAADRIAGQCRALGIRAGLIELGGDISVIGPHPDRSPWQVGIQDPRESGRALASLSLRRGALASSGDYERFMEVDGKRYSHLLDPRTGWPVEGLAGVSVVADQCLVAGTATTIGMLKGRDGVRWLRQLGLPHLWIRGDGSRGGSLWPKPEGPSRSSGAHRHG